LLTALNLMEWMPPPDGIAMCQVSHCLFGETGEGSYE
jgi:hypothetical protein